MGPGWHVSSIRSATCHPSGGATCQPEMDGSDGSKSQNWVTGVTHPGCHVSTSDTWCHVDATWVPRGCHVAGERSTPPGVLTWQAGTRVNLVHGTRLPRVNLVPGTRLPRWISEGSRVRATWHDLGCPFPLLEMDGWDFVFPEIRVNRSRPPFSALMRRIQAAAGQFLRWEALSPAAG